MSVPDTLRARVANVPESGTLSGSSCGRVICSSSERGILARIRSGSTGSGLLSIPERAHGAPW